MSFECDGILEVCRLCYESVEGVRDGSKGNKGEEWKVGQDVNEEFFWEIEQSQNAILNRQTLPTPEAG